MIKFTDVRKSFGDREILKGISFDVPAGESQLPLKILWAY